MLTDTGPLVALVNSNEASHALCLAHLKTLRSPMITTLPCLTEAAYLLRKTGGWSYVENLWQFYEMGLLSLHFAEDLELQRIREIMTIYRDTPCYFADASLAAAAETLGTRIVFTLDSHFYAYRLKGGESFEVKPK